jgi:hypothetical protein
LEVKEKINTCSSPLWFFHILFAVLRSTMGRQISRSREKRRQGIYHKAQYRKCPMVLGSIS